MRTRPSPLVTELRLVQGGFCRFCRGNPPAPTPRPRASPGAAASPPPGDWSPHSLSQTGQHSPGVLPGCLQGVGGQGGGSHWILPFCQKGLVNMREAGPDASPSLPGSHTHGTAAVQAGVPRAHGLPAAVVPPV